MTGVPQPSVIVRDCTYIHLLLSLSLSASETEFLSVCLSHPLTDGANVSPYFPATVRWTQIRYSLLL
jgi:hypothetical protein